MEIVGLLLVLDGYSLAFRAFFALPETMITSSGQYTNAVHGFTSMLLNLIKDHKPTHLAVAFDHPAPTFRDELAPSYKGHRPKTPESLSSQLPLVGQIVQSLDLSLIEAPGFEADDVIATLSKMAVEAKMPTIVVTGDRDSFQLVSDPFVRVLFNRRGVSDYQMLDEAAIVSKMGVKPELYPQFAALRGDPSDNIPGVPGVGEKTAAKLLMEYGSIEELLKHLDSLTPKLRASLEDYRDQLAINIQLTPLVRDVPLEVGLDELKIGSWDPKAAHELFKFLELNRIWDRTLLVFRDRVAATGSTDDSSPSGYHKEGVNSLTVIEAKSEQDLIGFLNYFSPDLPIFFEPTWSGVPGRSELKCFALVGLDGQGKTRALFAPSDFLSSSGNPRNVFTVLSDGRQTINGVGLKEVLRYLYSFGFPVFSIGVDGAVAEYLLDPSASSYELSGLVNKWIGPTVEIPGEAGTGTQMTMDLPGEIDADNIARRAELGLKATFAISEALKSQNLEPLYNKIERPLICVLAKMEAIGILVDRNYLVQLQREFATQASALQIEIQEIAGERFNVNSTQQLGKILFEKLQLPPQKKNKTGYSTDAQSLERLIDVHPIIPKILRYREVEKLRSTYGESLIAEIAEDGRIHASFSQTVARTGRLSSDHPNLHNIPIRTEDGKRFREAFVAPVGRSLVIADYSQIELRVIAHLSKDPGLIEAFSKGIDIHRQTASYTFGVALDDVTASQRGKAKMVAYGLAYGMEAYGLSQRLGVTVGEADEILKSFFAGFPNVKSYMESTVARARSEGFTTTEFGRRRLLPELDSPNYRLRQAAERQAMNAGIQGLAADIFKIALVKLDKELETFDADIVLQVHDEVLVECDDSIVGQVESVVKRVLEDAVELSVPLEANVSHGKSWAAAK